MPNLDALGMFSPTTAGESVTATAASANVVPLSANRDLGQGEPIKLVFQVMEAFTDSSSDSTVTVTVEVCDDPAFGSGVVTAQTIGVFAALSAIGTKLEAFLQPGLYTKLYMRAKYTVANGSLTTGKILGFVTDEFNKSQNFPVGTSVL